jgi:hypothetical protein
MVLHSVSLIARLSLFSVDGTADKLDVQRNVSDCQFVLKLCFQSNRQGDGLSIIGSAIYHSSVSPRHLSSDELETLLVNRATNVEVERAEQHQSELSQP